MIISILRLGHRLPRDERITTHVALVSRAFGTSEFIYSGQHDSSLESSVSGIVSNWGGELTVRYEKNYLNVIKKHKEDGFVVCHLTMYGMPLPGKRKNIKNAKKLLVIVGAEQVPRDVYDLADFNIAITNQPHSEVAALGIFLNDITDGKMLENEQFKNAKLKIVPSERGKKVEKISFPRV